jgi:hypothetical protein
MKTAIHYYPHASVSKDQVHICACHLLAASLINSQDCYFHKFALWTKISEQTDVICYFRNPYITDPFTRGSTVYVPLMQQCFSVSCHHGMAHDTGCELMSSRNSKQLCMYKKASSHGQLEEGWSSNLGAGMRQKNPKHKMQACYLVLHRVQKWKDSNIKWTWELESGMSGIYGSG